MFPVLLLLKYSYVYSTVYTWESYLGHVGSEQEPFDRENLNICFVIHATASFLYIQFLYCMGGYRVGIDREGMCANV